MSTKCALIYAGEVFTANTVPMLWPARFRREIHTLRHTRHMSARPKHTFHLPFPKSQHQSLFVTFMVEHICDLMEPSKQLAWQRADLELGRMAHARVFVGDGDPNHIGHTGINLSYRKSVASRRDAAVHKRKV